jgi:hypothetical protein
MEVVMSAPAGAARRPVPLPHTLALGLAGIAAAVAGALVGSPGLLALWIVPDVALLAGMDARAGRLAPRAVPLYNALHALWGPLVLIAAGALLLPVLAGTALVWLSHVLMDRSLGYGLRTRDGWQRG